MRFSVDSPSFVSTIQNNDDINLPSSESSGQYARFLEDLDKTYIEFETVSTTDKIDDIRRLSYRNIQTYAPYLFHVLNFSVTTAITRQEMIIKMQMIPVISSTDQTDSLSVDDDQIKAYGILDIEVETDYRIIWTSDIQMSEGCRIVADFPIFFLRKGDKVNIKMYLIRSVALGGNRWNCISSFRFTRIEDDEDNGQDGRYLIRIQTRGNINIHLLENMVNGQTSV